jgi:hypothetical protein
MREELGFDPLPDVNMDLVYIPSSLILIEDAAVPTAALSLDNMAGDGTDTNSGSSGDTGSGSGNAAKDSRRILLEKDVNEKWNAERTLIKTA